jgi:membrane protein
MKFKTIFEKITRFVTHDIWIISTDSLTPKLSFLLKQFKILILAFRKFNEDKIQIRSAALTFYSVLSIVPVAAMAFGIAKGFGFEKYLRQQLTDNFSGHEEAMTYILNFANSFLKTLEKAKGGIIAGVGVVLLLYTVMKVFSSIETSFNAIWMIKKSRSLTRKFTDYLSLMLIAPILFIVQSTASVYLSTQIKKITLQVELLGYIAPLIFFLIRLTPFVLIWILFTMIYMVMPNTKVQFKPAMVAGIIAGSIYMLLQWAYIKFQIGVSSYNAIYGSFAALPMLLIWMNWSWMILLTGATISFANQNLSKYESTIEGIAELSHENIRNLALLITSTICKRFQQEEPPYNMQEIANKIKAPLGITRQLVQDLTECKILSEVIAGDQNGSAYQPAVDVQKLTISYVIQKFEKNGSHIIPNNASMVEIQRVNRSFDETIRQSPENKLLINI